MDGDGRGISAALRRSSSLCSIPVLRALSSALSSSALSSSALSSPFSLPFVVLLRTLASLHRPSSPSPLSIAPSSPSSLLSIAATTMLGATWTAALSALRAFSTFHARSHSALPSTRALIPRSLPRALPSNRARSTALIDSMQSRALIARFRRRERRRAGADAVDGVQEQIRREEAVSPHWKRYACACVDPVESTSTEPVGTMRKFRHCRCGVAWGARTSLA